VPVPNNILFKQEEMTT